MGQLRLMITMSAVTLSAATAFGIGEATSRPVPMSPAEAQAARDAAYVRVALRFDAERSKCSAFAGFQRDNCVVAVHSERSRALMALKRET